MKKFLSAFALLSVVLLFAGCASSSDPNAVGKYEFPGEGGKPATTTGTQPTGISQRPSVSSTLRVGDMIAVDFSDVPLPGLQSVRARIPADGYLSLHLNVRVKAAEKTIPELEKDIREAYVPRLFRQLTAIVRAEDRFFFVGGEVKSPNKLQLQSEMTVLRAIDAAGGFTDYANHRKIILRRENGQQFEINEYKAREHPELDLPVLANDQITVKRRILF